MSLDAIHTLFTTPHTLILLALCALITGMSKMGFPGCSIIVTPLLIYITDVHIALTFGTLLSYSGDIAAVTKFKKQFEKSIYWSFMFWSVVGLLLFALVGRIISKQYLIILIIVFMCIFVTLLIKKEFFPKKTSATLDIKDTLPISYSTKSILAILAGGGAMIVNSAGAFTSIYLLSLKLSKQQFIGLNAFFFFSYNTVKFLLLIFLWQTLTLPLALYSLILIPFTIGGAYASHFLSKNINENIYRKIIISLILFSIITLFMSL